MSSKQTGSGETQLETAISYMLIVGVILSLVLEVIGIFLLNRSAGLAYSQNPSMYIHGNNFFAFVVDVLTRKNSGGAAVLFMTLGIIVLIATPYIRLVASVFYFGWEKNLKYVLITIFVLVVVTLSLALH